MPKNKKQCEIPQGIEKLIKIRGKFADENIPINNDIDIKNVEFRESSAKMAVSNLDKRLFT